MTLNRMWLPAGALALVLGAGGISIASAQDRGDHRERVQRAARGDRRSEGQAVERNRERGNDNRNDRGNDNRAREERREDRRDDRRADRNDNRGWRGDDRDRAFRRDRDDRGPRVYVPAPRVIVPRYPHRYGSGGSFSVYFGIGSGYRYGAPYSGRVYGYRAPIYGGARRYYGDVRLQVRPRDAAVYVDGYYAGIVDDFDGVFQRLTLEVGPHEIEIELPGFEPQVYNVYVDPNRTVDVRADLYPDRY